MQGYDFHLYLQCQKKQNMKTKEETRREIIAQICLAARAIKTQEDIRDTIAISRFEFEKTVENWANHISRLNSELNKLNNNTNEEN